MQPEFTKEQCGPKSMKQSGFIASVLLIIIVIILLFNNCPGFGSQNILFSAEATPPRTYQNWSEISGEANSELSLAINNETVPIDENGRYSHRVLLSENGINIFYVVQGSGGSQQGIKVGILRWSDQDLRVLSNRTDYLIGKTPFPHGKFANLSDWVKECDRDKIRGLTRLTCKQSFFGELDKREVFFMDNTRITTIRLAILNPDFEEESNFGFDSLPIVFINEKYREEVESWITKNMGKNTSQRFDGLWYRLFTYQNARMLIITAK